MRYLISTSFTLALVNAVLTHPVAEDGVVLVSPDGSPLQGIKPGKTPPGESPPDILSLGGLPPSGLFDPAKNALFTVTVNRPVITTAPITTTAKLTTAIRSISTTTPSNHPSTTTSIPKPACRATNHGIFNSYNGNIAIPYAKAKCKDIKHTVQGEVGLMPLTWWDCKSDKHDRYWLKFDYWFYNAEGINQDLAEAFPAIGEVGEKGFECPDY